MPRAVCHHFIFQRLSKLLKLFQIQNVRIGKPALLLHNFEASDQFPASADINKAKLIVPAAPSLNPQTSTRIGSGFSVEYPTSRREGVLVTLCLSTGFASVRL